MIELMIERWIDLSGATDYRWSLWREGGRVAMDPNGHPSPEDCEVEARAFCRRALGRDPDRVTRL